MPVLPVSPRLGVQLVVYAGDQSLNPAAALVLAEVVDVPAGGDRVYPEAVVGERVHECRYEHRLAVCHGSGIEGRVEESTCLVKVALAVCVCAGCLGLALPGEVNDPGDGRAEEGEAGRGEGSLRRGAVGQERDRGEAEKAGGPVTAEHLEDVTHGPTLAACGQRHSGLKLCPFCPFQAGRAVMVWEPESRGRDRALRDHCGVAMSDQNDTGGFPAAGLGRAGTPRFRLVEIHVTSQAMRELPRPFAQFGSLISSQVLAGLKPVLGGLSDLAARSLAPVFSRLAEALPENWRDIRYPCLEAALELMNDGIPLIWVPRSSVVARLMQASGAAGRADVLADARRDVADDCDAVLADITAPHLASLAVMAAEAVRTLRDGYCAGAQALATDVFDTWLQLMVRRSILFDPPPKRIGFYPNVVRQIEPVSGDLPIARLRAAGALQPPQGRGQGSGAREPARPQRWPADTGYPLCGQAAAPCVLV